MNFPTKIQTEMDQTTARLEANLAKLKQAMAAGDPADMQVYARQVAMAAGFLDDLSVEAGMALGIF